MEMVEDWRKVDIPVAIQERIIEHHTEKEQSCAAGEWWVHTGPYTSWYGLAITLYRKGEDRALEKMAQYLPKGTYIERGYYSSVNC